MIPIVQQPEPSDFDQKVRQPGLKYLASLPPGRDPDWSNHAYWRNASRELWQAYRGICAYYSCYFEYQMAHSVDHFDPKTSHPTRAYEWSNYRLCSMGENAIKNKKSILDPFLLKPDSFFINFQDGSIYPNPTYPTSYQQDCRDTARALKLDTVLSNQARVRVYTDYKLYHYPLVCMEKYYPFVYHEIVRQGLV